MWEGWGLGKVGVVRGRSREGVAGEWVWSSEREGGGRYEGSRSHQTLQAIMLAVMGIK